MKESGIKYHFMLLTWLRFQLVEQYTEASTWIQVSIDFQLLLNIIMILYAANGSFPFLLN